MILLNDYDDFLDIMAVTLDFVYGYQDMGRDLRPFSDPHDNSKSKGNIQESIYVHMPPLPLVAKENRLVSIRDVPQRRSLSLHDLIAKHDLHLANHHLQLANHTQQLREHNHLVELINKHISDLQNGLGEIVQSQKMANEDMSRQSEADLHQTNALMTVLHTMAGHPRPLNTSAPVLRHLHRKRVLQPPIHPPPHSTTTHLRIGVFQHCAVSTATVYRTPIGDLPIDLEGTRIFIVGFTVCLFNYMHYDKKHGAIHRSIEALDRMGMDIIETGNPDAFKQYLSEYDNTICGRHPISVFLHMLRNCSTKIKINFLQYEQSSQCKTMRDSSVSYASAAAKLDA
ncbi:hypothetical protein ACLB2K_064726 [Fragaria x ananassa]